MTSSLKQISELFLAQHAGGATELRMKIKVDVLGRLGTFGLSAMKTKADRMWDSSASTSQRGLHLRRPRGQCRDRQMAGATCH